MKKLAAKVGEYTKGNETKGEWVQIGVIMSGQNGEYALIDPKVNLAGVLQQQNIYAHEQRQAGNDKARTGKMIMCSVFDQENQQSSGFQPIQPISNDDIPF